MKLLELVLNAKKQFKIIEEIMVVVNGAHLHPNTKGTYVLISKNQRIDLSGDLLSDFLYAY